MESNKNYFLVGLFVLATIVTALIFVVWLTSAGRGDYVTYRIRFNESVSGLSVGGLVKFRGVNVGTVEEIEIDKDDSRLIKVLVRVDKDTPIKPDTVASLKLQGITGVVFVELTGGSNHSKLLSEFAKGGNIPEIPAKSSPLTAIVDRLPEMVEKISVTVEQINKILSDQNVASLGGMLKNTEQVTSDLKKSTSQIDGVMRDLRKTTRNISNLSENLEDDPSRLIFPAEEKGIPAP